MVPLVLCGLRSLQLKLFVAKILGKEILVFSYRLVSLFLFALALELFLEELSGWLAGLFNHDSRFEPAVGDVKLLLNLLPHEVEFVHGVAKLCSYLVVVAFCVFPGLVRSEVIPVKAVFEGEGVRHCKLFPNDHAACAGLVGFDFESAVLEVEHVRFLRKNSRKQAYDCPAEEATVGSCVAAVEERVLLF